VTRRGTVSRKSSKTQHRKATSPKRSNAPRAARRRSPSAADLQKQLDQRTCELAESQRHLAEALDQQTATSEVLAAIARSSGELQSVFNAMLSNATRLCEASYGLMLLCEGDDLRSVAVHGPLPPAFIERWQPGTLIRADPDLPAVRAAQTRQTVQVADLRATPAYLRGDPFPVSGADVAGIRTMVAVPMLKDDQPIGVIAIYRREVRAFTDKQIELVTTFCAQAVIAIENARLLNELRESLQQQTATADVLKVISRSPGSLEPVFQAMMENAIRICGAEFGGLFRYDGDAYYTTAHAGMPAKLAERLQHGPFRPGMGTSIGRMTITRQAAQIADLQAEPTHEDDHGLRGIATDFGVRTILSVPMFKDRELMGAIVIFRQEVRPFTDKQVEVVSNFANQAVIAIENTRLLNELRESLAQQTATSEVLHVISRSPNDLKPVFQTMLENATRICHAKFGVLQLYEGRAFRIGAIHNAPSVQAHGHDEGGCPDRGSDGLSSL
jgi:GAF domain-containing protein